MMTFLETILGKILLIFKKEGIEANSESDIIRKLDIGQSTFKELFSDKTDMIRKTIAFDIEDQKRGHLIVLADAENAVQEIIILLQDGLRTVKQLHPSYVIDLQTYYPEIWQMWIDHFNVYIYHQISEVLNKGIVTGGFRKDINIQLVTKIILEQLNMMLNPGIFPPDRFELAEVFRSTYLYYVRGFCTESGGKIAEQYFSEIGML